MRQALPSGKHFFRFLRLSDDFRAPVAAPFWHFFKQGRPGLTGSGKKVFWHSEVGRVPRVFCNFFLYIACKLWEPKKTRWDYSGFPVAPVKPFL